MKLIKSEYDKETGLAFVEIKTRLGNFSAFAKPHQEDIDIKSNYLGCFIAEMKATIQYYKEEQKILKIRINTLENYQKLIKGLKEYSQHSRENRKLRRVIYELKEDSKFIDKEIKNLEQVIEDSCKDKRIFLKRIEKIRKEDK